MDAPAKQKTVQDPALAQSIDISLENVCLTLNSQAGPVDILQNINLQIDEGESVAIVGQSGSGKTSLLMVMAGLEPVTSGHVRVREHDLAGRSEDELAMIRRSSIGIVFQSFHLVPTMTALENTALPLEFAHERDTEKRARAALEEVGLSHRLHHYPAQLSGGEQQRVALARALAPKPKYLLADEPTGNLDAGTGAEITDMMFALQKNHHMTLVLVTHDDRLANRCQRIVHIADGKISDAGTGKFGSQAEKGA